MVEEFLGKGLKTRNVSGQGGRRGDCTKSEASRPVESGQNGLRPGPVGEVRSPGQLTVSDERCKDIEGVCEATKVVKLWKRWMSP